MRAREVLDEKYAVVQRLGAGACADVYEAENLLLGRRVALKVLRPELARGAARREGFLQQGRLAARLEHSHIAAVLDLGEVEERAYIVVEMLSGEALQSAVRRSGSSLAAICDLLLQVLAALEYAHGEGIVHGGLHPKNVFVVYPRPGVPWVKVTDFGLRCSLDRSGLARSELAYLAPEAERGVSDARSDVYSAAALLYTLLAGEPPPANGRVSEQLLEANSRLPRTLVELIAEALCPQPERRVQSAASFGERLAPFAIESAPRASLAPEAMYAASLPSIRWKDGAQQSERSSWGSAGTSLALAGAHGSSIGPACQSPQAARDSCVTESLLRNPRFPESGGSAGRHWRTLKTHFLARPNTGAAWMLAVASVGAGIACALLAAWLQ